MGTNAPSGGLVEGLQNSHDAAHVVSSEGATSAREFAPAADGVSETNASDRQTLSVHNAGVVELINSVMKAIVEVQAGPEDAGGGNDGEDAPSSKKRQRKLIWIVPVELKADKQLLQEQSCQFGVASLLRLTSKYVFYTCVLSSAVALGVIIVYCVHVELNFLIPLLPPF